MDSIGLSFLESLTDPVRYGKVNLPLVACLNKLSFSASVGSLQIANYLRLNTTPGVVFVSHSS
jgi:hypothetical protein